METVKFPLCSVYLISNVGMAIDWLTIKRTYQTLEFRTRNLKKPGIFGNWGFRRGYVQMLQWTFFIRHKIKSPILNDVAYRLLWTILAPCRLDSPEEPSHGYLTMLRKYMKKHICLWERPSRIRNLTLAPEHVNNKLQCDCTELTLKAPRKFSCEYRNHVTLKGHCKSGYLRRLHHQPTKPEHYYWVNSRKRYMTD